VRLSSFWPPRKAYDRFAAEAYQRRNQGVPWLPKALIELLPDLLLNTDRCLEWGSGSSTAWLGTRVASILSIEHDPLWLERTRAELGAEGLDPASVRLLSTEPREDPSNSPYVRVVDEFGEGELNVCLVDGEHRASCIVAALPRLASGALLILDDAHGFLDHRTSSPHSRQGRGPLNADWGRFADQVRGWRHMWISDGYSDAAVWIKP
jgi:predicted O-methyltransferase YrrM